MKLGYSTHIKGANSVTQKFAPNIHNDHSSQEEGDIHQRWYKVDEKAKYIMLESLDNVL